MGASRPTRADLVKAIAASPELTARYGGPIARLYAATVVRCLEQLIATPEPTEAFLRSIHSQLRGASLFADDLAADTRETTE